MKHGIDEFVALPGRHARTYAESHERPVDLARGTAPKQIGSSGQRARKILFANKFFFRNGGSEVVMFDEMELMEKHGLDVIEFSMRDARNLPSRYELIFRLAEGLPVWFTLQPGQVGTFAHSFPRSREADHSPDQRRKAGPSALP